MNKPTNEQIRRLWEWCGLILNVSETDEVLSTHLFSVGKICSGLLVIDLNNLFKYAVPKLKSKMPLAYWVICLIEDWAEGKNPDPALALLWVIYQIIEGEQTNG